MSVSLYLVVIIIGLVFYRPTSFKARNIKKVIEKYENNNEPFELLQPIQHLAWNLSRDAEANEIIVSKKAEFSNDVNHF